MGHHASVLSVSVYVLDVGLTSSNKHHRELLVVGLINPNHTLSIYVPMAHTILPQPHPILDCWANKPKSFS